jgi:four helix bundle protein
MYFYPFEKLEVWQLSKSLVVNVYKITETFPQEEKFGMVSQMRRASVSVCSNLAEGAGRNTAKDQGHFYGMAYSSLMEVLNQLLISVELGWISEADLMTIRRDIETVSLKINALRKATLVA